MNLFNGLKMPFLRSMEQFYGRKIFDSSKIRFSREAAYRFLVRSFKLNEVTVRDFSRFQTKIREFDNMIGGGVVPGSLILLGGSPGIGKSTLMLHISDALSKQGVVLYISGEESLSQVKSRAERLKVNKKVIFF